MWGILWSWWNVECGCSEVWLEFGYVPKDGGKAFDIQKWFTAQVAGRGGGMG